MNTVLEQAFLNDKMGVCIKDSDGHVLQQNKLCHETCGDCIGKICKVACMELYVNDDTRQWQNWGSRVYNNSFIYEDYYDVTLLCSDEHLITFFQPLKEKHETALSYYKSMDLTKRELEVITLIVKGASNLTVCEKLYVSKATLKTHLNKIYKKVKDRDMELKYIPHNRLTSRVSL